MERLMPGGSLVDLSLDGRDAQAFEVLADVLARMFSSESRLILRSFQPY
jgi:hypothetical protein